MIELSDKQISLIKKTFPEKVGILLKKIRVEKQITQTQLANAAGKDRQYIYKIEKGKVTPNISTLFILLSALEISLQDFFKNL